jgi:hypothetical protein
VNDHAIIAASPDTFHANAKTKDAVVVEAEADMVVDLEEEEDMDMVDRYMVHIKTKPMNLGMD